MGAWIQAWGKHSTAVTQDAKAAHFPSSANQHRVKDTPIHKLHPSHGICLTPGRVKSQSGEQPCSWSSSTGVWPIQVTEGCSLHSEHAQGLHSSFPLPPAGCQVLQLPLSSLLAPPTQRAQGVPLGHTVSPTPHNQHNQPATSSHNGAFISPHSA